MKSNKRSLAVKTLFAFICIALFSFSSKTGGDSFEIWLNGKKVLQQFVYASKGIQTLHINEASPNDKMELYYSHCGQVGKSRYITIKDESNHPVKVWKFADATGSNTSMPVALKDILILKKNKDSRLSLFYSSQQLPEGRTLAIIAPEEISNTVRK
jgi:hypothetical protein